jgi:hypothetical protein
MSTAASILREREREIDESVSSSADTFDLRAPLTEDELVYAGLLGVLPAFTPKLVTPVEEIPLLRDIEDSEEPVVDAIEALTDRGSYNQQYAHYMRCQALVALAAFTEGWSVFETMALKSFVTRARRSNEEYRGSDPNKAFELRIKQQTAEDFIKFIRAVVNEAIATPKPALASK